MVNHQLKVYGGCFHTNEMGAKGVTNSGKENVHKPLCINCPVPSRGVF